MRARELLRTDTKTRAEVEQLEIGNGTMTPDEGRAERGLKPLPKPKPPAEPDGDEGGAPDAGGPPGMPAPGGSGADNGATASTVTAPTPIPGTSISETPVKVKA